MASINENKKTGLLLVTLTGGAAVALSVLCYPFVSPALRRICLPYVPATTSQVENVLEALRGRSGPLLDIGSGDGRIVLAAAKAGFPSHGVELNPWLVSYARIKAATTSLAASATFSCTDLWKFPFGPYKNIIIFGVEEMMTELEKKFDSELKKDVYIVACRFPLPGKLPMITIGTGVDTVWVYKWLCQAVTCIEGTCLPALGTYNHIIEIFLSFGRLTSSSDAILDMLDRKTHQVALFLNHSSL